jgi:hypothetical protein
MQIEIINCRDNRLIDYIVRAIEFYGEQLISKRILNNIHIEVNFDDNLEDLGGASIESYNTNKKPRSFLIEINKKLGGKSILSTLAHEMVHIKQFVYCETNEDLSKWKDVHIDSDVIDYYDLPWEIEAYGKEQGLFYKFVVKEKLWDVFEDICVPNTPPEEEPVGWKEVDK